MKFVFQISRRTNGFSSATASWARAMVLIILLVGTADRGSAAAKHNFALNYTTVVPGLDYATLQTSNWNSGDPLSIHIARLDRKHTELRLAENLAHNEIFGVAPVSAIAGSFPKSRGEPLVAINAGFCIRTPNPYIGAPRGIGKDAHEAMVIVDGEVVGAPSKYSFWVNEDRSMHFGDIKSLYNAKLPGGEKVAIGMNRECFAGDIVLFTHTLGKQTRASNHLELVLENAAHSSLSWRVGETLVMRVKAINLAGNSGLSNTVCVLTFSAQTAAKAGAIRVGDTIQIDLSTSPSLQNVVTACHGVFPVVHDGKPLEKFDAGAVIQHRNPRTAIGFNDQYFFMVVVDGRQKHLSMGMNSRELAEFMAVLGCREAMNMDGGGSSTFWKQGKVCNSIPGGKERTRADSLMVVREPASPILGKRAAK
ncbi:MAG: phosphodiester glycosidase family protein [Limisphaerales bacterium]